MIGDNTAHLVAETLEDAKQQWVDAFARNRSDLGPGDESGYNPLP